MMPGHAFVIGDGLDVQRQAMLRVPLIHVDVPGTRPVLCSSIVVSRDRILGAKWIHGDDLKLVLRQPSKQFGQLCFHLPGVFGVQVEHLLARSRVELAVVLDVFIQAGQVLEAKFVRQRQHLCFGLGQLLEADLVDFLRGQVGRGHAPDLKAIPFRAIGQRPDSRLGAAVRSVIVAHKCGKAFVRGKNFATDRSQNSRSQPLLIGVRNTGGEFAHRLGKRAGCSVCSSNFLRLRDHFFQQVSRLHQPVFHSLPHVAGHLIEHPGDLMQSRKVVVVVLHTIERRQAQVSSRLEMRAIHLVDRHFPGFEARFFNVLAQVADHQLAAERILRGQACGIKASKRARNLRLASTSD